MLKYQEILTIHPQLLPYIQCYVLISGKGAVPAKKIYPKTGATVFLDFNGWFSNGKDYFNKGLSGLHETAYHATAFASTTDRLMIWFTPFGLSRFTNIPANTLTNQIVELNAVFGKAANYMYEFTGNTTSLIQRIGWIEKFLMHHFREPTTIEKSIFYVANQLNETKGNISFDLIRAGIPLSTRQLERKFKALIGVDIQTFIRLCRFDFAKTLLLKQPSLKLTEIGQEAQYYDQSHFIRDFKTITGTTPKRFSFC